MNHLEVLKKVEKALELHSHIEDFLDKEYSKGYRAVFQTACQAIAEQYEKFFDQPSNPLFELALTTICLRDREELIDVEGSMIIEKYTEAIKSGDISGNEEGLEEIAYTIHRLILSIGRRDINSVTQGKRTSLDEAQEMAVTYLENL